MQVILRRTKLPPERKQFAIDFESQPVEKLQHFFHVQRMKVSER